MFLLHGLLEDQGVRQVAYIGEESHRGFTVIPLESVIAAVAEAKPRWFALQVAAQVNSSACLHLSSQLDEARAAIIRGLVQQI